MAESIEFSASLFADLFDSNAEIKSASIGHYQTYGFIMAIVSSPEKLAPKEWQPLLFVNNKLPEFSSPELGKCFTYNIRQLWDMLNQQLADEMIVLPEACSYSPVGGANNELVEFCSGYLKAYVWLKAVWDHAIAAETDDSKADMMLKLLIFSLMMFSKGEESMAKKSPKDELMLTASKGWKLLPTLLTSVGISGQAMSEIERLTIEQNAKLESVQPVPKIGRNDLCYCGSGKKYKKCCLQ